MALYRWLTIQQVQDVGEFRPQFIRCRDVGYRQESQRVEQRPQFRGILATQCVYSSQYVRGRREKWRGA